MYIQEVIMINFSNFGSPNARISCVSFVVYEYKEFIGQSLEA